MADQPRVLVIEDEPEIRRFLRAALTANDYVTSEAADGKEGLLRVTSEPPDVIVLDLGLPDMSGFDVIAQVRGWSTVPIIILSARGREADKVAALDAGADDYLTKPFAVGELLARIRVALRHAVRKDQALPVSVTKLGDVTIDFAKRLVTLREDEVHLTPTEYRLLTTLVKYLGRVVTHRQLLREVWGPDSSEEHHYLRVYVNQLRQKLGDAGTDQRLIITEPGVGYRLKEPS